MRNLLICLQQDFKCHAVVPQRQVADCARMLHTGDGSDAFQRLLKKCDLLSVRRIFRFREAELKGNCVARIKARINRPELQETFDQERGTC